MHSHRGNKQKTERSQEDQHIREATDRDDSERGRLAAVLVDALGLLEERRQVCGSVGTGGETSDGALGQVNDLVEGQGAGSVSIE